MRSAVSVEEYIDAHWEEYYDFLRRRFMDVSAGTIHFDLRQLARLGLVRKLGKTRGALYVPGNLTTVWKGS